jgi:predicted RNA-binding Zn ribbon-like protein
MQAFLIDSEVFPLLDEPFVVEFANTLYQSETETIDFLATRMLIEAWFQFCVHAARFDKPRLSNASLQTVRDLRNCVHTICAHIVDNKPENVSDAVATLNRIATVATKHTKLRWSGHQTSTINYEWAGKPEQIFLARLADEAITFFASDTSKLIKRCATPVCNLLFVQEHHRRNFCTELCSQRTRQHRYHHNKKTRT